MKNTITIILAACCLILVNTNSVLSQQENVPVDHPVYTFLKEMSVKDILSEIHDDNPLMSRAEVKNYLDEINSHINELSSTEKSILRKYQDEFYDDKSNAGNTYQLFGGGSGYSNNFSDLLSQKIKFAYAYRDTGINFYLNILGRAIHGQNFEPNIQNTELFDFGFRFRGTLFDKLGYSLSVIKGGIKGSGIFAAAIDPRLNYNFKYVENKENIGNYDFTEGYLRYYLEPVKKMKLSFEIGREKMTFGYGYGSKLVLSGNHPVLDFVKIDFTYGVFSFSSWTASTVGVFDTARSKDYTKYIATNRFKLSFKNLFDFGLGESVIYSGRGIDLAYLNPLAFYKFEEMSLQDRDNGTLWLDFQTHFIKDFELQGTFFLDDNPLGNLQDLSNFINKTGYQIGAFWYSPFSINDLSLVFEYTKIRPYVYSHDNPQDTYMAWGQVLGHRIGPNSDEILLRASYNFSDWVRFNFEYQYIRHGENIYDAQGNLIYNSGGDPLIGHRANDPIDIQFLSGERINTNIFILDLRLEPVRQFVFDIVYTGIIKKNITRDISGNSGYGYLKLMFEM